MNKNHKNSLRTELGINLAMFQEPQDSLDIAQWPNDVVCPTEWQRRAAVVTNILQTSLVEELPAPKHGKSYVYTEVQIDGIVTSHQLCNWHNRTPFLLAYTDRQDTNGTFSEVLAESLSQERCMLYLVNETVHKVDDEMYWDRATAPRIPWENLTTISSHHMHGFIEKVLSLIQHIPKAANLQQKNLLILGDSSWVGAPRMR